MDPETQPVWVQIHISKGSIGTRLDLVLMQQILGLINIYILIN